MNYNTYPQQQQYINYRPTQQLQYGNWNGATPSMPQVRPVSSIEEVRACPIDFDGSVFYFPDLANKRIYTKQINLDGTATLNMYELKQMPIQQESSNVDLSHFVTREELEQIIFQLRDSLEKERKEVIQKESPVINF